MLASWVTFSLRLLIHRPLGLQAELGELCRGQGGWQTGVPQTGEVLRGWKMISAPRNTIQPDKPQSTKMRVKIPRNPHPCGDHRRHFDVSRPEAPPSRSDLAGGFIHSLIHSFSKYLLSAQSTPGPTVGRGDLALSETDTSSFSGDSKSR